MKRLLPLLLCLALLLSACGTAAEAPAAKTNAAPSEMDSSLVSDFICTDNNRVFYEIFVGSFSDSDGDGTGDLRGIIRRMDYLNDGDPNSGKSLGVEGLWLTPIFLSPSYHKYDVSDYYTIDPAFGTLDDLKELCALCEERNVKLILDLPINHTGSENAWFSSFCEAHRKGETDDPWYDFYSWCPAGSVPGSRSFLPISGSDDLYECNFSPDMPELNFDSEAVRTAVLDVARFYLELGVDGFRFDAAKYVYLGEDDTSAEFWSSYLAQLRAIEPELYTVGEVWSADMGVEPYLGAMNCFNFTLAQAEGLIAKTAAGGRVGKLTGYVEEYLRQIRPLREDATIVPFVTNHDMDRAAGALPTQNGRMQMAANLYLLGPGSPFIYYGEELGMRGSRGGSDTDANRRLAMPWGDGDTVTDPPGANYPDEQRLGQSAAEQLGDSESLLRYYQRLLMIRHANPEIARGEYSAIAPEEGKLGGFVSVWEGKAVCVLHNTTRNTESVDLSTLSDRSFSVLAATAGLGEATLEGTTLTLGAQTSVVLREG